MMGSNGNEEQPLLKNGKRLSWTDSELENHVKEVSVNLDLRQNGLNRRDKSGESFIPSDSIIKIPLPTPEREELRFPPEKWKTFVAFVFLSCNLTLNLTVLAIVHDRLPDKKYPPLPDIFFDVVPLANWALDVSEILIMVSVGMCLVVLFFHKHRFIIFHRIFLMMGILYFMRSVTMLVTQVPVANPSYFCSPKVNNTTPLVVIKRVLQLMSGFGLSINGQHTYCGDYIYSGHTVILTMSYLIIKEYTPQHCYIFHLISFITSVVGIVMVLVSRGHYTVDVVIAYYVTTRIFWIYHTLANNANLKSPGTYNYFSKVWWFPIFSYFEKNIGGVVPNKYEWPLPSPRQFLRHSRTS